ncbi:MAG: hypothetical protein ABW215_02970 [Kibdelosporangium sp.]
MDSGLSRMRYAGQEAATEADDVNGVFARPWMRTTTTVLTSALAVGGITLFGAPQGNPAQDVRLLSGSAWLSSGRVGQLTLLDGSSAEVAAQVQVAPAGDVLDVVQQGPGAYAVDQTAGTIRRVDGSTFEVTQPEAPITGAGNGLAAFAGPASLYVVDTRRGLYTNAEPRTGRALGSPRNLPAQIQPGSTGIDGAGRLWIIDNATGDLTWVDGDQSGNRRGVTQPGRSMLTIVNGKPVIVDTTARRALTFDPDAREVGSTIDLDLRPDENIQVSGSTHDDRLYVVAARGVLTICELAGNRCDKAVPLAEDGDQLGAAVEAENRLFVPNYTTGQVWIIDPDRREVVAKAQVLKTAKQFQLLTRDGVVFFNDQDSEHAGVIRVDGGVQETSKYDPKDPRKGLTAPITDAPGQQPPAQAPTQPNQQQSPPPGVPPATPRDPAQPPVNPPPVPNDPPPPDPAEPPPAPPPNDPSPDPNNPNNPPVPVAPTLKITLSKNNPVVNEDISLKVDDANGTAPTSATWNFADTKTGNGALVTHQWAVAKSYQVTVKATMPDHQEATTAITVQVGALPKFTLTVTAPPNGTVSGGGIQCPPTCKVTVDKGTKIPLTPQDNGVSTFTAWGGGCAGPAVPCTVTMDAAKTVSATFTDVPPAAEDCVTHAPGQLRTESAGADGVRVVEGADHWMFLLDNQQDADNALSVARGFTAACYIGRPRGAGETVMTYWKGGAGRAGPVSGEDCIAFTPSTLFVVRVSATEWSLRSGNMLMESFKTQAQASRGLKAARQYTKQCFIGRDNKRPDRSAYIMEYWR